MNIKRFGFVLLGVLILLGSAYSYAQEDNELVFNTKVNGNYYNNMKFIEVPDLNDEYMKLEPIPFAFIYKNTRGEDCEFDYKIRISSDVNGKVYSEVHVYEDIAFNEEKLVQTVLYAPDAVDKCYIQTYAYDNATGAFDSNLGNRFTTIDETYEEETEYGLYGMGLGIIVLLVGIIKKE